MPLKNRKWGHAIRCKTQPPTGSLQLADDQPGPLYPFPHRFRGYFLAVKVPLPIGPTRILLMFLEDNLPEGNLT